MKNEVKIINCIIKMLEDGASINLCIHDLRIAAALLDKLPSYEVDKIIEVMFGEEEENAE